MHTQAQDLAIIGIGPACWDQAGEVSIRGVLHSQSMPLLMQVNINASCHFVKDVLRGDDVSEMRLKLLSQKSEVYPYTEDD